MLLSIIINEEGISKSKEQLAVAMIDGGLLSVMGDYITTEADPSILVCKDCISICFMVSSHYYL